MTEIQNIMARHGIKQNGGVAAVATSQPAAALTNGSGASHMNTASELLLNSIEKIVVRAKVHGAIQEFHLNNSTGLLDPAVVVEGIKAWDAAAEFDTSFSRGAFSGRGGRQDKRAVISLILVKKFGADVVGKTPEGEEVTASIWKDKMTETLAKLPLNDVEKAKVAGGIEGKLNPAIISLDGRGFEMSFWEREKDGAKSFNVSDLHATAGGATNGNGGGQ